MWQYLSKIQWPVHTDSVHEMRRTLHLAFTSGRKKMSQPSSICVTSGVFTDSKAHQQQIFGKVHVNLAYKQLRKGLNIEAHFEYTGVKLFSFARCSSSYYICKISDRTITVSIISIKVIHFATEFENTDRCTRFSFLISCKSFSF